MQKNNRSIPALLCAALGNTIFGFSFLFSRIALLSAEPFVMLAYRFAVTALLLAILAFWAAKKGDRVPAWMRFRLRDKKIAPLIGMGLIQPVGYFLCESYGISLTNSTFSGVMIALVPIAAMIFGAVSLREIPRKRQIAFALLSIAGVILMTVRQRSDGQIQFWGVLLLLGAVVTGSYFNVLSRRISRRFSALERTVVMMWVAAVVFCGLALIQTKGDWALLVNPLRDRGFLWAVGYLSVCSSIVAFLCLNYANNDLPVAKTASFANLTTVVSLFAGVLFLHEPFSAVSLVASVMIVVGVWGSLRA